MLKLKVVRMQSESTSFARRYHVNFMRQVRNVMVKDGSNGNWVPGAGVCLAPEIWGSSEVREPTTDGCILP